MPVIPLIEQPEYIEKILELFHKNPLWGATDIAICLKTKRSKVDHILQHHLSQTTLKTRAKARAKAKRLKKLAEITPQIQIFLKDGSYLSTEKIAKNLKTSYKDVATIIETLLTPSELKEREAILRSKAKNLVTSLDKGQLEELEKLSNYIPDGKGYLLVLKPDWFTGRAGSKHIYVHQMVMLTHLGLTEMPKDFVVHHINGDKTDNRIENLSMLTNAAHLKQHQVVPLSNQLTLWEMHEFMTWKSQIDTAI